MNSMAAPLHKIVSGGQTGVDRGALDAAIEADVPHGGWCPRGRRAEDGAVPDEYQLTPTDSYDYTVRTERNVLDSEGTLILCRGALSGGTKLTRELAKTSKRPVFIVDLKHVDLKHVDSKQDGEDPESAVQDVLRWLRDHEISVLNVAGPRESQQPGIALAAHEFLRDVLSKALG